MFMITGLKEKSPPAAVPGCLYQEAAERLLKPEKQQGHKKSRGSSQNTRRELETTGGGHSAWAALRKKESPPVLFRGNRAQKVWWPVSGWEKEVEKGKPYCPCASGDPR